MITTSPAAFTAADAKGVTKLCNATCPSVSERTAATGFEKPAIRSIFGGNIVVRAVPDFFNLIFTSDKMVVIHGFLRDHVEGVLYAILPPTAHLSDMELTTNRIDYQIQESVAFHEEGCEHVVELLQAVKAITYDREKMTFHFRFFIRAKAIRWESQTIPYWKAYLTLRNVGSALPPEIPATEVKRGQIDYQLCVSNVAEHVAVHYLHEYLKAVSNNTVAEFKSVDRGGRGPHLSATWTVRFLTSLPQVPARGDARRLVGATAIHPALPRRPWAAVSGLLPHGPHVLSMRDSGMRTQAKALVRSDQCAGPANLPAPRAFAYELEHVRFLFPDAAVTEPYNDMCSEVNEDQTARHRSRRNNRQHQQQTRRR